MQNKSPEGPSETHSDFLKKFEKEIKVTLANAVPLPLHFFVTRLELCGLPVGHTARIGFRDAAFDYECTKFDANGVYDFAHLSTLDEKTKTHAYDFIGPINNQAGTFIAAMRKCDTLDLLGDRVALTRKGVYTFPGTLVLYVSAPAPPTASTKITVRYTAYNVWCETERHWRFSH